MKVKDKISGKTKFFFSIFLFSISILFFSCKNENENALVIWTNSAELLPYIELFNKTHDAKKVLLVYKENPSFALEKETDHPDLIIAPFLHTTKTEKFFRPLDCLFDCTSISQKKFYRNVLSAGKTKNRTFLLPVSFNVSAFIFSKDKSRLMPNRYTISLSDAKKLAAQFNADNDAVPKLGFAVQADKRFLYFAAKTHDVRFRQSANLFFKKNIFLWNKKNLSDAVSFLSAWIYNENVSPKFEQNFIYKYLFMPNYKQGAAGNTLFSYAESAELFTLSKSELEAIDYRWLSDKDKFFATDDTVQVGIPRKAKYVNAAKQFLQWFFENETQKQFLEIEKNAHAPLTVAGGFSSLIETNEESAKRYMPFFFLNPPPRTVVQTKSVLPSRWNEIKQAVVLPYLFDAVADSAGSGISLEKRILHWKKEQRE